MQVCKRSLLLKARFGIASSTGAAANADSTPSGRLVIADSVDAATVTVTGNATGDYTASVTIPSGATIGAQVELQAAATVGGVAGPYQTIWMGRVVPAMVFDSLVDGTDKLQGDVQEWKGATAQDMTGDAFARLGSPTGASIAADIATKSTLTAQQVWEYATRSLTTFGTLVADIWGAATSALTTVGSIGKLLVDRIDATIGSRSTYAGADTGGTTTLLTRLSDTRATKLDNLDAAVSSRSTLAAGDAMTLTAPAQAALVAALEAEIANDATGAAIKQAIVDKLIENLPSLDDLTLAAIAQAVWTSLVSGLTTPGSIGKRIVDNLDAQVSSRSTYGGGDTSGTSELLTRLSLARAGKLDNLDQTVGSRLAAADFVAPDNSGIGTAASNAAQAKTAADAAAEAASLAAGNAADAASAAGAVSTKLASLTENVDGERFTAHALGQAPAAAGSDPEVIAGAVNTLLSATHGAGSWESGAGGGSSAEDIDAFLSERHGAGSWETPKAVVTRSTLARYLTDLVEWVQVSQEQDGFGNPLVDPITSTIQGRIKLATKVVTTIAGAEVVATGHVLMFEQPAAGFDILRWNDTDHPVLAVDEERAFSARAYRAYFQ